MKITSVKAIGLRCTSPTISDAMSVCRARQALWVKIEMDNGLFGIGEAFLYGSPLSVGKAVIEDQLAQVLIGENPSQIEQLWQRMYWRNIPNGRTGVVMGCISGIDIALWDVIGKHYGVPISDLLGKHSDWIPAYASGGFYADGKGNDQLASEVERYLKMGYKDVKIKIGRVPNLSGCAVPYTSSQIFSVSLEEDINRIAVARSVMGKKGRLAADINAAWDSKSVIKAAPHLINAGLDILEEPIRFEDENGLQEIRKAMPQVSLMGYETAQGCQNFARLIKNGAVDIVQPDIGWGGGISELRKIGAIAQASMLPISLHSFGSCVHFAASLQLASSFSNTEAIESEENPNVLKTGLMKNPFEYDENMNFKVPGSPGLGIEIDWEKVDSVRVF